MLLIELDWSITYIESINLIIRTLVDQGNGRAAKFLGRIEAIEGFIGGFGICKSILPLLYSPLNNSGSNSAYSGKKKLLNSPKS